MLSSRIAALGNAVPIEGMEQAWVFTPAPGVNLSIALSNDGSMAFQMNTVGPFYPVLSRSVLRFARGTGLVPKPGRPLQAVPGFACPPWPFDVVGFAVSPVHRFSLVEDQELHRSTIAVFPGFHSEFLGQEDLAQATVRFRQLIKVARIDRQLSPYIALRFENSALGFGSAGPGLGLATLDELIEQVLLLEGAVDDVCFVEFENFQGGIWLVRWDGSWQVSGATDEALSSELEITEWLTRVTNDGM